MDSIDWYRAVKACSISINSITKSLYFLTYVLKLFLYLLFPNYLKRFFSFRLNHCCNDITVGISVYFMTPVFSLRKKDCLFNWLRAPWQFTLLKWSVVLHEESLFCTGNRWLVYINFLFLFRVITGQLFKLHTIRIKPFPLSCQFNSLTAQVVFILFCLLF